MKMLTGLNCLNVMDQHHDFVIMVESYGNVESV